MFEVADADTAVTAMALVEFLGLEVAAELGLYFVAAEILLDEISIGLARRGWHWGGRGHAGVFAINAGDAPAQIAELFL